MHRNFRAIALIAVALISGCGQVSGTAQPATELFDPCAVVPDEAIRAAGADPATGERNGLLDSVDWEHCTWMAPGHFLNVSVTTRSIQEIASNDTYSDIETSNVKDRPGSLEYGIEPDLKSQLCVTAMPWSGGTVAVMINRKQNFIAQDNLCTLAHTAAEIVSPTLPK